MRTQTSIVLRAENALRSMGWQNPIVNLDEASNITASGIHGGELVFASGMNVGELIVSSERQSATTSTPSLVTA